MMDGVLGINSLASPDTFYQSNIVMGNSVTFDHMRFLIPCDADYKDRECCGLCP